MGRCLSIGRVRHALSLYDRVLMGFAAAFGSVGLLMSMAVFHHKVRKPKFRYGVPALLAPLGLYITGFGKIGSTRRWI